MTRKHDIIQFVISLLILAVVGVLTHLAFAKFDLTEEKRHTLTDATIELLESTGDQIFIRCYLHGDFPAKFTRLENHRAGSTL